MGRFPVMWNVETAQMLNPEGALLVLIGCFVLFTLFGVAMCLLSKGDKND